MSCTVSELPSGCHLRGISSSASSAVAAAAVAAAAAQNNGGANSNTTNSGGIASNSGGGGIHVGGILTASSGMGTITPSSRGSSAGNIGVSLLPETAAMMTTGTMATTTMTLTTTTTQRHQQQSQKPCCFCWCCCCSCSCLAIKNAEDNAPTKRDAASADLLLDGEQPSLDEIRSWGKSFDLLMKNAAGRKVFRDFLRSEFSEENILFWLACEELKKESSPEAIEEKARLIYEDYISILSPREVSLDSRVREIVNRNMVEPTTQTFDEAQIQIYTLMHRDSYPRFLNSQKFKALAQLQDGSLSAAASTTDSPT